MNNGQFKHFAILSVSAVVLTLGALQVGGSWTNNVNSSVQSLASIAPAAGELDQQAHDHSEHMVKEQQQDVDAKPAKQKTTNAVTIGAEFELIDQNGDVITHETLHGNYSMVFFGFTACPDVCPAGLLKMKTALEMIGDKSEMVTPVFVTVDPDRDTPEVLNAYLSQYGEKFVGITGDHEKLDAVQDGYKVYSARVEDENSESYLINHSAYVYLMDRTGEFVTVFSSQDTPKEIANELKEILSKDQQG